MPKRLKTIDLEESERILHQIHQTADRCNIFFFGVETSGGLGKEARQYVKLLARLAGGPMGVEIERIYQQIAVELQTARANQVTRNRFVLHHPPPQPGSLRA